MKLILIFAFLAVTAARPETVASRFRNMDLDEVFSDIKTLKAYTNCLLGIEECTPEGSALKKMLPETLKNNCNRCTEEEKIFMARYGKAVLKYMPEEDEKLTEIYDPDRKYEESINEFIQKYGY